MLILKMNRWSHRHTTVRCVLVSHMVHLVLSLEPHVSPLSPDGSYVKLAGKGNALHTLALC